jgi:hypothetical protein
MGFNQQTRNELEEAALTVRFPWIEYTLDVDIRGDQLRVFLRHCSQKSLSSPVEKRDGTEIDRACASVPARGAGFSSLFSARRPTARRIGLRASTFVRWMSREPRFATSQRSHLSNWANDRPGIGAELASTGNSRDDLELLVPTFSSALAHMHF